MKTKTWLNILLIYILVYVSIIVVIMVVSYLIGFRLLQLPLRDVIIVAGLCLLAVGIGTLRALIRAGKKRKDQ